MLLLKRLLLRLLGQYRWQASTEGAEYVWKRYNPIQDAWETRPMSAEEVREAQWVQAIK